MEHVAQKPETEIPTQVRKDARKVLSEFFYRTEIDREISAQDFEHAVETLAKMKAHNSFGFFE